MSRASRNIEKRRNIASITMGVVRPFDLDPKKSNMYFDQFDKKVSGPRKTNVLADQLSASRVPQQRHFQGQPQHCHGPQHCHEHDVVCDPSIKIPRKKTFDQKGSSAS